jgi:hypothetical protein
MAEHAAKIEAAIAALHDQLAPNAQLNNRMRDAVAQALRNADLPPSEVKRGPRATPGGRAVRDRRAERRPGRVQVDPDLRNELRKGSSISSTMWNSKFKLAEDLGRRG